VQWLDGSSVRVLAFALRRIERERIGILLTRRLEASACGGASGRRPDRAASAPRWGYGKERRR
jgi:hypothetical protein